MKGCVLIVDDEPLKRITLQIELSEAGYVAYEAADAETALRWLESCPVDVVITDLKMPGMDGLSLLEEVRARRPDASVIMMTAYGTVDTAVEAIKRGAYDYITKPFSTQTLLGKLEQLGAYRQAQRAATTPLGQDAESSQSPDRVGELIGQSYAMRNLFAQIRMVADSERTILIEGESGTGKELVAEAIHQLSRRRDRPLIRLSCAALQPTVLESELFGHERGAFTGAIRQKLGRFELADRGTMFLDDVDDIPPDLQVKLLRAIEQQQFERVGGEQPIRVDVRLICATKKDLRELVEKGQFRQDLYYRLNVIHLLVPPLRQRKQDIPVLVNHFICKHAAIGASRPPPSVCPRAMDLLMRYSWPGNVRELEHVIERALAFCRGPQLELEHIPALREGVQAEQLAAFPQISRALPEALGSVESEMIRSALRQAGGNQARAAELLKIPRTTLRDKMAKYGIGTPHGQRRPSPV